MINLYEDEFIEILKGNRSEFIKDNYYFPAFGKQTTIIISNALIHFINCNTDKNKSLFSKYPILIENSHFTDFAGITIECKSLRFENCRFMEHLNLSGIECYYLGLNQCKVDWPTSISNCTITTIYIDCQFKDITIFNNNFFSLTLTGIYKDVKIAKSSIKQDFYLLKTKAETLVIEDNEYNSSIYFKEVQIAKVFFQSGIFNNPIEIRDSTFDEFNILNGEFKKGVNLLSGTFENELLIKNGTFKEDFEINGGVFKQKLSFEGGKFEKNISIFNAEIRYLKLDNIERLNKFLTYKNVFIDKFSFSATKGNFNVFIHETHFNQIEFWKAISIKDNFFQFNQARVHELNFDRFSNLGNIYFIDIQPEDVYTLNDGVKTKGISLKGPKVIFRNSDLGKTTFIDCDLTGFNLEFQSSKISEVFLAGTEMPLSENILSKDKKQKRLALSQIKKIYENRGDSLTANEYYAEEMKTYMSQLFTNLKVSQIPEFLNLVFNRISNNFGQSWFLALTSTIIIVFLSLELFTRSLNFPISNDIWAALKWKMGLMFDYINPTTKIKDFADSLGIKHEKLTSNSKFIFGLTRFVIIPYFVYQLIAAFRKHGKKS